MKKLEGFYLKTWITHGGMLRTILRLRSYFNQSMPALKEGGWAETKFKDCTMENMWDTLCTKKSGDKPRILFK